MTLLVQYGFCYAVEFLQWINVLSLFNLSRSRLIDVVTGTTFSWLDMLCYTLGGVTVVIVEFGRDKKGTKKTKAI
ncbi:DUF2809 domain-containing protein [Wenyingzhuangia sp. 2_MG-2023]|uniref:DUF2809 domain-containing protein n=1 Tax=Wenyingzhuangia sp. 2_MG-2023 TaxID=3062639 RepID=UPI0034DECC0C